MSASLAHSRCDVILSGARAHASPVLLGTPSDSLQVALWLEVQGDGVYRVLGFYHCSGPHGSTFPGPWALEWKECVLEAGFVELWAGFTYVLSM